MVCRSIVCRKDMYSGMVFSGSAVSCLSSCRPSWSGCGIGWGWGEVVSSVSELCLLKYVTSLLPRSSPLMSHCPLFSFWRNRCRSRKVLLCLLVLSYMVCLQPLSMWVLFRGDRHFLHMVMGPCFLLHLCTWTPPCYLE